MSLPITIVCPAVQLPYEICVYIFTFCLPTDPLDVVQPDAKSAPLLLCHICSSWRITALSAPSLWQSVSLRLNVSNVTPIPHVWKRGITQSSLDALCWWIENAQSLPLRIQLQFKRVNTITERIYPIAAEQVDLIGRALSSAQLLDINRLCAAAFRAHPLYDDYPLLTDHPNLDTLIIRDMPYQHRHGPHVLLSSALAGIFPLKSKQPNLRRLYLDRYTMYLPDVHRSVSWGNLTHICIVEITIQMATWFQLVRQFVVLESGQFHLCMDFNEDGGPAPPPASLDHLKQLHLRSDVSVSRFLENLALPALTSLRIDGYFQISGLHRLLESTPNVRVLHLGPNTPWHLGATEYTRFRYSGTTPLSRYLPSLSHLLLAFSEEGVRVLIDTNLLEDIIESPWLDLRRFYSVKLLEIDCEALSSPPSSILSMERLQRVVERQRIADRLPHIDIRKHGSSLLWTMPDSLDSSLSSCFNDLGFAPQPVSILPLTN